MFERKVRTAVAPAAAGAGPRRRVRLRPVEAGLARLKALIGPGLSAELDGGGLPLRMEVADARPAGAGDAHRRLWLQTPGGPIALAPARDLVRALTAIDLPDDDDGDPLQALRLELAAQALPANWLGLFGASALLSGGPHGDGEGELEVALTLVQPGARRGVPAVLQGRSDALLQALSNPAWQRLRPRASPLPVGWKLRVPVAFGRTEVPARTCRELAAGDVVFIGRPCFDLEGQGVLRIGSRSANCVLHVGNQVRLELTEWDPITMDSTMHEPTTGAPSSEGQDGDAFDDVPVLLSFELGSLELSLAELKALGPGSVVPVAGPLPPEVAVCAGGRRIGTGEIVELDGRLGVEIRRIGAAS